jgi:hypothetical protein
VDIQRGAERRRYSQASRVGRRIRRCPTSTAATSTGRSDQAASQRPNAATAAAAKRVRLTRNDSTGRSTRPRTASAHHRAPVLLFRVGRIRLAALAAHARRRARGAADRAPAIRARLRDALRGRLADAPLRRRARAGAARHDAPAVDALRHAARGAAAAAPAHPRALAGARQPARRAEQAGAARAAHDVRGAARAALRVAAEPARVSRQRAHGYHRVARAAVALAREQLAPAHVHLLRALRRDDARAGVRHLDVVEPRPPSDALDHVFHLGQLACSNRIQNGRRQATIFPTSFTAYMLSPSASTPWFARSHAPAPTTAIPQPASDCPFVSKSHARVLQSRHSREVWSVMPDMV